MTKLNSLLKSSNQKTKLCKICLSPIDEFSLPNVFYKMGLCNKCLSNFKLCIKRFLLYDFICYSLFKYDQFAQGLLHQFKGCYDIELKDTFLFLHKSAIKLLLFKKPCEKLYIVPIPSFRDDDVKRGFNHVEEMFKCLNLPMLKCIKKIVNIKQSSLHFEERQKIQGRFILENEEQIEGKNILIVDDVFTTGATIKEAIRLIKQQNPKSIRVLVVYKVDKYDT